MRGNDTSYKAKLNWDFILGKEDCLKTLDLHQPENEQPFLYASFPTLAKRFVPTPQSAVSCLLWPSQECYSTNYSYSYYSVSSFKWEHFHWLTDKVKFFPLTRTSFILYFLPRHSQTSRVVHNRCFHSLTLEPTPFWFPAPSTPPGLCVKNTNDLQGTKIQRTFFSSHLDLWAESNTVDCFLVLETLSPWLLCQATLPWQHNLQELIFYHLCTIFSRHLFFTQYISLLGLP